MKRRCRRNEKRGKRKGGDREERRGEERDSGVNETWETGREGEGGEGEAEIISGINWKEKNIIQSKIKT